MSSARSILAKPIVPKKVFRTGKRRGGGTTKVEKLLVAQFVADQPRAITPAQITGLAMTLRRSKAAVRNLIEEAREVFVTSARDYVDIHKTATEGALATGDFEVAAKSAQWALTNISQEGARIVDKVSSEPTGSRVMIGIQVGGVDAPKVKIEGPE